MGAHVKTNPEHNEGLTCPQSPPNKIPERWWGWGTTEGAKAYRTPQIERLLNYLVQRMGPPKARSLPPPDLNALAVPPHQIPEEVLQALRSALGPEGCNLEPIDRLLHSLGQSYPDLLRRRLSDFGHPPDGIVYPEKEEQIQAVLQIAHRNGIRIIPFGGGTSVLGGVEAKRKSIADPVLTMDLGRCNRILEMDKRSCLARIQAGIRGPALEKALNQEGFTLGHFPQSFEHSTLGGWIATRSWGQCSTKYGSMAQRVRGVRLLTPNGPMEISPAPGQSTGPDLQELIVGSEGILGVIAEATVELHPVPETRIGAAFLFPDFAHGTRAIQALMQADFRPALCRLSDTEETKAARIMSRATGGGLMNRLGRWWLGQKGILTSTPALLLLGFEGRQASCKTHLAEATRLLKKFKGASVGSKPVHSWYEERYQLPYLRDTLMDHGYLVETFETSVTWSHLEGLYRNVRKTLEECVTPKGQSLVLAHLSHPTRVGSCVYFTAIMPQEAERELEQWRSLKTAATETLLASGGCLSHHHGMGADHLPWASRIHGAKGIAALTALKAQWDPEGLMNPGKVIP